MANYVITRIEASDGFDFTKSFQSFNDVLKMPSWIKRTESGSISSLISEGMKQGLSLKEIVKPYRDKADDVKRFVYAYIAYKRSGGYADWYDWSIWHWGCKWDMDVIDIEKSSIEFQTPWSFPDGAINALIEKYPDVRFHGEWAEECPGYYSGEFSSCDGIYNFFVDAEYSQEAYERYFTFWGGEEDYALVLNEHNEYTYQYIDE